MIIFKNINKFPQKVKNPVVAIGVFDGLHLGHQALMKEAIRKAKLLRGTSIAMTFYPHPIHVLYSQAHVPLIVSLSHRLKIIEELGVDISVVIPFTKQFSKLTPEKFVKRYLVDNIGVKAIVIGEDFRFGQGRSGNWEFFKKLGKKYNFKVNVIRSVVKGGEVIGSTRIRKLIAAGKLTLASQLLGRRVSLLGKVVKGEQRGKSLGFPTANLNLFNEVIPPHGVYLVRIQIQDKIYNGIANIGRRPSFNDKNAKTNLEIHIFDFNKNIYGQDILVEYVKKIRNEKKFSSKEQLIQQIIRDEKKAKEIFTKHSLAHV